MNEHPKKDVGACSIQPRQRSKPHYRGLETMRNQQKLKKRVYSLRNPAKSRDYEKREKERKGKDKLPS